MREIKELDTADGKRYRVRYRLGKMETSETFRRKDDAADFAAILSAGGVAAAATWLEARKTAPTSLTFGAWFEEYVEQLTGVSPRTRNDYRSLHRRYFADLDRLPLPLVTRTHITSLVNSMERAGRSPKTIKQAVHLISSCMALAIDEGHCTANPCRRVRLPKQSPVDAVKPRFLTREEVAALVAATPAHYKPLVVFLVGTGLRWSEATALQGRHVDIENGTVRVEQAWKRVPGEDWRIGPPKTPKSTRTVNAAVIALAAVKPLLRKPNDWVFTTQNGGILRHANFYTHVWKPACKAAGLNPAPRIHDTRHTHASWLISDGNSLEAVQDQLGHESILTTRAVYGHLQPALGVALGRSASAALAAALPEYAETLVVAGIHAVQVADQAADPHRVTPDTEDCCEG